MTRRPSGLIVFAALSLALSVASARAQTVDDLFNPDVMLDLHLRINSADWTTLQENFQLNTYYPCDFVWQGQTVRNVGIRSRGNGSRSATKPGLRVDFDRYSTTQKFLGLKSVVLDNLTQDPSMMREFLSMRLFRRLGLPASREAFVRLFVNGRLIGLYALVESVDKDFLTQNFGENDGYLYEYDYTYDYNFAYLGSEFEPYQTLFDPKTHETDSLFDLYSPIESMIRQASQSSDAMFESTMSAYLDLGTFARHVALENFLAEDDGILGYAGMNNFYFYRFENSVRSQFIIWDMDNTFNAADFPILRNIDRNELMRRVFAIPSLRQAYYGMLLAAADSVLDGMENDDPGTGWLARDIEKTYALVRSAALEDTNKPYANDQFETGVGTLRVFARTRSAFVRGEVSQAIAGASAQVEP